MSDFLGRETRDELQELNAAIRKQNELLQQIVLLLEKTAKTTAALAAANQTAERGERISEIERDNERLRGLLADAYDELRWHYLSKAGDLGIPHERAMTMISEMPLMRRIKAAKEAAK